MPVVPFTRIFGLIGKDHAGDLVLSQSRLLLADLLPDLMAGMKDHDLLRFHDGLKTEEIKAAKAYLARFGPDLLHPSPLPPSGKILLLDENITYTVLPTATRLFGFCSHVEAEGLSRQNLAEEHRVPRSALDSRIARFAATENFAGIITKDADFADLYNYPAHPIRQLHVFLLQKHDDALSDEKKLIRHQDRIRHSLAAGQPDLVRL